MLNSIIYPLLSLSILEQLSTATPVLPNVKTKYYDPVFPKHNLKARDEANPWPPSIIDWPFPANKSDEDAAEAPSDVYPPGGDQEKPDKMLYARNEISKAFIDKSCTNGDDDTYDERGDILDAWYRAGHLVDAQTNFVDGYNYDIPHTQWLGPDWNNENKWSIWKKDFRKRNKENFSRLKAVFSRSAPKHDYIFFHCTDPQKLCKDDGNMVIAAYQWSERGYFWSNHYINFCRDFFDLSTLEDEMNRFINSPSEQRVMENFEATKDGTLLHEMWHMQDLVSVPRARDYAYESQNAWNLAKNKGTWWATENADSYQLDAVAIRTQQFFKSSMSPVPREELKNLDAEAYANTSVPTTKKVITKVLPDGPTDGGFQAQKYPDMDALDEITWDIWPDTPKPESEPQPTQKKAVSILADYLKIDNSDPKKTLNLVGDIAEVNKLHWVFLETDEVKNPVGCRHDYVYDEKVDVDRTAGKTNYPEGTKKMKLYGQDCEYTSNSDPGAIKCGDQTITCKDDLRDTNPSDPLADKGRYTCDDKWTREPVFWCEW